MRVTRPRVSKLRRVAVIRSKVRQTAREAPSGGRLLAEAELALPPLGLPERIVRHGLRSERRRTIGGGLALPPSQDPCRERTAAKI